MQLDLATKPENFLQEKSLLDLERYVLEEDDILKINVLRKTSNAFSTLHRGNVQQFNKGRAFEILCAWRIGKVLQETERNKGDATPFPEGRGILPTLADLGLTYKQSHFFQRLAQAPYEKLVKKINQLLDNDATITFKNFLQWARKFDPDGFIASPNGKYEHDRILVGDFREVYPTLEPESFHFIFTDPPYHRKNIHLYEDLAKCGQYLLRPGGSLICYCGHYAIPEILDLMRPYLKFWWLCGIRHTGNSARLLAKQVFVSWKPLLWFVKDKLFKNDFVTDMIDSEMQKGDHRWQQGEKEASYYIEHLTLENQRVLDPMCGSGTTLIAAKKLNREFMGIEKKSETALQAGNRLNELAQQT